MSQLSEPRRMTTPTTTPPQFFPGSPHHHDDHPTTNTSQDDHTDDHPLERGAEFGVRAQGVDARSWVRIVQGPDPKYPIPKAPDPKFLGFISCILCPENRIFAVEAKFSSERR